jgi:hypothetical protein
MKWPVLNLNPTATRSFHGCAAIFTDKRDADVDNKVNEVLRNKVSRRKFIAGIGAGVGATAAVALAEGCSSSGNSANLTGTAGTGTTTPAYTDSDYLNFALNLEYLEAEFYLNAATGSGLSAADALTGAGAVTGGGTPVPTTGVGITPAYSALFSAYLNEVAQDELNHVRAIQATITSLGGTPVPRPAIALDFFANLAVAAGITTTPTFTPFDSIPDFLIGSFTFEDVGVTAYTGAAPLITSGAVLNAAAGIQAVEAYHAAIVRTLIVAADFATSPTSTTYQTIANQVSTLRATLGGGNETALGKTSIVAASSSNAVAYSRTPAEVLNIVFGQAGTGITSGGFFPAGLNGNIKTT